MLRITLLTAASVLALGTAHAADTATPSPANNSQTSFQAAIQSIKTWFGSDAPVTVQPIATNDDVLQAPTPVEGAAAIAAAANAVEPAAGDDMLQAPPPYTGPGGMAQADITKAINDITPAAGGEAEAPPELTPAPSAEDKAISCKKDEGDTSTVCDEGKMSTPVDATAPAEPTAQPATGPMTPAQPLPSTQPAAGDAKAATPSAGAPLPVPAKAQ